MNTQPHVQSGLRTSGVFAQKPMLGLTMFLVGSFIFGIVAYNLGVNESLTQWDMTIAKLFRTIQKDAPWNWMENLLFGCFIGKELVVVIAAILTAYFLHKRFWRELTMLLLGVGGSGLIWYFLSHFFNRPRPADHLDMLASSGPSFPSGPVVLAVLCYGLLAYVLIPNLQSPFWRWVIAFLSASAVIVTGLSSLLFGTHYFIDVIAGYALGLAWTGFVYTLAEKIFQNRLSAEQIKWHPISLSGLRLPVFFKKRPLLGLVLILFSALILALLGYNILTERPLTQLDMIVYKGLLAQAKAASPVLNDIMLFGFFVGKQSVQLIVMLLSLYFLYQRYWLELLTIQVSAQGGGILWNFLIGYFSRPRPSEQLAFATDTIPSFPSGHTLGAMICYGFLAYLLIPKMPSFFWKCFLSFFLLAILLFEGFTRMFHGNHYLTDVLAGYALGIFWLVLVCTLMENIFVQEQKE